MRRNAIIETVHIGHLSYQIDAFGNILNQKGTDYVVASLDKDGYKRFRNKYVHRLVYETFVGEIPKDKTIDHIDGNKQNNHISNLQVLSRGDNSRKSNSKIWHVISPDGVHYEVENMEAFCQNHNLHPGHMRSVAAGKRNYKSYRGWKRL